MSDKCIIWADKLKFPVDQELVIDRIGTCVVIQITWNVDDEYSAIEVYDKAVEEVKKGFLLVVPTTEAT